MVSIATFLFLSLSDTGFSFRLTITDLVDVSVHWTIDEKGRYDADVGSLLFSTILVPHWTDIREPRAQLEKISIKATGLWRRTLSFWLSVCFSPGVVEVAL